MVEIRTGFENSTLADRVACKRFERQCMLIVVGMFQKQEVNDMIDAKFDYWLLLGWVVLSEQLSMSAVVTK